MTKARPSHPSLIHEGKGALLGDAPLVEQWQQNPLKAVAKSMVSGEDFPWKTHRLILVEKNTQIIIWLLKSMPNIWVPSGNLT